MLTDDERLDLRARKWLSVHDSEHNWADANGDLIGALLDNIGDFRCDGADDAIIVGEAIAIVRDAWRAKLRAIAAPRVATSTRRAASAPGCAALDDCRANSVDWRARALAAESDCDDARSWRNAVSGAKEPGDPVIRAVAALLDCTYLDAVPTPDDNDWRREVAVAGKIAHDENRADAARWRNVAPLIECMREVNRECDDATAVVRAAIEILAATQEPTP